MLLDGVLDRFNGRQTSLMGPQPTNLTWFITKMGWAVLWRQRYPQDKIYSCYSASHRSLSRIGYTIGSTNIIIHLQDIQYLPRGISDHSPVLCVVGNRANSAMHKAMIHLFWLDLMGCQTGCRRN
ncbi:hypothetical protein GDO81_013686 [Engystomops pustulosus]|uniref:Uncharacterized protein n=1 Tax=Engystomops pustulosus TaxID=76066 RepID=A0AAV7B4W8_ENGPU|nr:hypothetical protein GDO81_013686 [Engystomops pustulosus]